MVNSITTRFIRWSALAVLAIVALACTPTEPVVEQTVDTPVTRVVTEQITVTREVPVDVTATATPPLATATPEPTATLRPTATPVASPWLFHQFEPDPITGKGGHVIGSEGEMLGSDEHASLYGSILLSLSCYDGNFAVLIDWGGRFLAADSATDLIPMTYKVDDEAPQNVSGFESSDNTSIVIASHNPFARNLLDGSVLVARVTNYDDDTMTARFNIEGLRAAAADLECWP